MKGQHETFSAFLHGRDESDKFSKNASTYMQYIAKLCMYEYVHFNVEE